MIPLPRFIPLLLLLWLSLPLAQADEPQILEVFVSETCMRCADAKAFLDDLARQRPQLKVVYRILEDDLAAQQELIQHSIRAKIFPPGVPTFVMGDRVMLGFYDAAHSGPRLLAMVDEGLSLAQTEVDTTLFGRLSVSELGLPLFTLALGLIDGFNPCAMWVLLFLLSLLVHLRDRRRMALIAGTFVLASGAVYFVFMAAWLNVFLLLGFSSWLNAGLALLALLIGAINIKDFFLPGRRFTLSIPDAAKPGLYARMRRVLNTRRLMASMVGVAVLAVVVNFVELLCTAGIPAIYTAVLTQQDLSTTGYYAYLGLYIAAYIADDALMVALAVFALSSQRLTEQGGRWLKLISGVVMLALGEIMLLHPQWLF